MANKITNISSNGTYHMTRVEQLINGVEQTTYALFSLTNNKLDGTYHAFPANPPEDLEAGWWSEEFSVANGYFLNNPTITALIDKQALFKVMIFCDALADNYIVDADISFYSGDTLLRIDAIRGNTESIIEHIVQLDNVDKFVIVIKRINKEYDNARLIEVEASVEDDVVDEMMDAFDRRIYAKADIIFLDPFKQYTLDVLAAEAIPNTGTNQLVDGINEPTFKWFSLTNNKLDGSYKAVPNGNPNNLSIGWWSKEISDENGYFSTYPTITLLFTEQPVISLSITGDSKVNSFPTDFDIKLYDSTDTLIAEYNIVGNDSVTYFDSYTIDNVRRVEIIFKRVNTPNDSLRLLEVASSAKVTYYNDRIITLNTLEELFFEDNELPLGSVSANELNLTIDNVDNMIDLESLTTPYQTLLRNNRIVRLYMGVELYAGYIKWYPYGEYYSTNWNIDEDTKIVSVRALDALNLIKNTTYYNTTIFENMSVYDIGLSIIQDYKLMALKYDLDESLKNIIIPYVWFPKVSYREALRMLAEISGVVVYCSRENVLCMHSLYRAMDTTYTYRPDTSIISKKYANRLSTQYNVLTANVYKCSYGEVAQVYNNNESFTLDPAQSSTFEVSYTISPAKDCSLVVDNVNVEISSIQYFTWGAIFTVSNKTTEVQTVNSMIISGTPLQAKIIDTVKVANTDNVHMYGEMAAPTIDNKFLQDRQYSTKLLQDLLTDLSDSFLDLTMATRGNILLKLCDKVGVYNSENVQPQYVIRRIATTWNGFLEAGVDLKKV